MGLGRRTEKAFKRVLIRLLEKLLRAGKVPAEGVISRCRKILVIRQHNQMGDMLLAVPAFRAIKESAPGAKLGVVTSMLNRDVLLNNPHIDYIFSYRKKNPLSHIGLVRKIRAEKFDLVVVLYTVSFSFTSAMLGLISGAKLRAGSTTKPFGHNLSDAIFHIELPLPSETELEGMNETEHNLYPLACLGIKTENLEPILVPSSEDERWAEEFLAQTRRGEKVVLAVHPGAGKSKNIWPPGRFAEVVNRIGEFTSVLVLVIEGPRDELQAKDFSEATDERHVVVRKRRIGEVAALLKRSDIVLCNDTGIMHVACAVGARTLAVFGPTDPFRWAPKCRSLTALRAPGGELENLSSGQVTDEVLKILELIVRT